MAEPTSTFTRQTKQYIERVAPWAKEAADRLGVPATAILGAVANEYDTRFNPDLVFDIRGGAGQSLGDWFGNGGFFKSIKDDYEDVKSGNAWGPKFLHPAMIDVGPGNVRIETVIDLLGDYLASHRSDGQDPLELRQYENNYPKLVDDILDFNQPKATMAFAGLMVAKADAFFKDKNAAAWNRLSDDEKDALRVTYYKLGPEMLSKNIDRKTLETDEAGVDFNYNPYGDGGAQHLKNVAAIKQALERGLAGVDHSPAPRIHGLNAHKTAVAPDGHPSGSYDLTGDGKTLPQSISLSPADILRLKKTVTAGYDQSEGEIAAKAAVDSILNRLHSGRWGDNVRAVVNNARSVGADNGEEPGKKDPYDVDRLSVDDPRFADVSRLVDEHLLNRAAGTPSIVGNDLGYADSQLR
jgi:hypothetical protein